MLIKKTDDSYRIRCHRINQQELQKFEGPHPRPRAKHLKTDLPQEDEVLHKYKQYCERIHTDDDKPEQSQRYIRDVTDC